MKLAVWSGPRNISTAMMYAFGNHPDFAAWDEPFYAPYLACTGLDHPMAKTILATHETDPARVADTLSGPVPGGKKHWYLKHMPHHMLDGFPLDWAADCVNIHLIRHPARVIASYAEKRQEPTLDDIGFEAQVAIYNRFPGPVIDSADIRQDPEAMLRKLCEIIGLDWNPAILSWPAGPKGFDGAWAPHWYNAVHQSTGFAAPEGPLPYLPKSLKSLSDLALPHYEKMAARKL